MIRLRPLPHVHSMSKNQRNEMRHTDPLSYLTSELIKASRDLPVVKTHQRTTHFKAVKPSQLIIICRQMCLLCHINGKKKKEQTFRKYDEFRFLVPRSAITLCKSEIINGTLLHYIVFLPSINSFILYILPCSRPSVGKKYFSPETVRTNYFFKMVSYHNLPSLNSYFCPYSMRKMSSSEQTSRY